MNRNFKNGETYLTWYPSPTGPDRIIAIQPDRPSRLFEFKNRVELVSDGRVRRLNQGDV